MRIALLSIIAGALAQGNWDTCGTGNTCDNSFICCIVVKYPDGSDAVDKTICTDPA